MTAVDDQINTHSRGTGPEVGCGGWGPLLGGNTLCSAPSPGWHNSLCGWVPGRLLLCPASSTPWRARTALEPSACLSPPTTYSCSEIRWRGAASTSPSTTVRASAGMRPRRTSSTTPRARRSSGRSMPRCWQSSCGTGGSPWRPSSSLRRPRPSCGPGGQKGMWSGSEPRL